MYYVEQKLEEINKKTEEGKSYEFFDRANIAATTKKYIFTTTTKPVMLYFCTMGSEDTLAVIGLYEAPTQTVAGTALTSFNLNRGTIGKTTTVAITEDPTTTANGTIIFESDVTASEDAGAVTTPILLKAGTIYMAAITNPNAGPLDVWVKMVWTEE